MCCVHNAFIVIQMNRQHLGYTKYSMESYKSSDDKKCVMCHDCCVIFDRTNDKKLLAAACRIKKLHGKVT